MFVMDVIVHICNHYETISMFILRQKYDINVSYTVNDVIFNSIIYQVLHKLCPEFCTDPNFPPKYLYVYLHL